MTPPDRGARRRHRKPLRGPAACARPDRAGIAPAAVMLVALTLAIVLERLIYIRLEDHLAATMLALIVAVIVIVAIAPGARTRKP